jgi:hypothetical protein
MEPIQPFWFKQRQAKLEPAGDNTFKAVAPNQADAYLLIRKGDNQRWAAAVRLTADGNDVISTPPEFSTPGHAWEAAFELYRQVAIV